MIVACPACGTRYRVDDAALSDPAGRQVRCANCGHIWRQAAEAAVAAEPPAASRLEPPLGPPPIPPRRRRRHAAAIVLVLMLAAVALAGFALRDRLIALLPPASELLQLAAPARGSGLEIRHVVPTRKDDGLVITGEIVNTVAAPRPVPPLRVVLRDAAGREVQSAIVAPPKARLGPGEAERFETPFAHPNDAATGVVVTFAPAQ